MRKEKPFIRLSVKDLVWGYDEPIFEWLHEKLPEIPLPPGFETQFGFLLGVRARVYDGWRQLMASSDGFAWNLLGGEGLKLRETLVNQIQSHVDSQ